MVLRLSLLGIVAAAVVVSVIALRPVLGPGSITDSIDLGAAPTVGRADLRDRASRPSALIGVEAASGLAGEVRVAAGACGAS